MDLNKRRWNRMIDWKNIKKIDAHIHLMPPDVIEANKEYGDNFIDLLVFATDYPDNRKLEPIEIYDKYFEILSQMDFSDEEAEKICRLNALKMINK